MPMLKPEDLPVKVRTDATGNWREYIYSIESAEVRFDGYGVVFYKESLVQGFFFSVKEEEERWKRNKATRK